MKYYKPVSLDAALHIISSCMQDITFDSELIPLDCSVGRVLSKDVYAPHDLPTFNRSLVDGYAVRSRDTMGANESIPSILSCKAPVVLGESDARTLYDGEAIYVPTGGEIPTGADAVVMIEYTKTLGSDILVQKAVAVGENCSFKGEDIAASALVLRAKQRITHAEIGVLAALDYRDIDVVVKPRVSILSTGDELVSRDQPLKRGCVRDINSHTLAARLRELGCEVGDMGLIGDDLEQLVSAMRDLVADSDILLISGGSSMGRRDFTQQAMETLSGEAVLVNGLQIKPGKPTLLNRLSDCLVIGLPGHPVSCIRVFKALIEPYIYQKFGLGIEDVQLSAKLKHNVPSSPGKRTFQSVQIAYENGECVATALFSHSAWISQLTRRDGYIIIHEDKEGLEAGTMVNVYLERGLNGTHIHR